LWTGKNLHYNQTLGFLLDLKPKLTEMFALNPSGRACK